MARYEIRIRENETNKETTFDGDCVFCFIGNEGKNPTCSFLCEANITVLASVLAAMKYVFKRTLKQYPEIKKLINKMRKNATEKDIRENFEGSESK